MDYDLKTRAKQFIKTTKQFPDLDQDDEKLLHHSVVVDGLQLLDFEGDDFSRFPKSFKNKIIL
jgi:hypothetical protein